MIVALFVLAAVAVAYYFYQDQIDLFVKKIADYWIS